MPRATRQSASLTLARSCQQYLRALAPAVPGGLFFFCLDERPESGLGKLKSESHMNLDVLYSQLLLKTDAKLALVVLDGLGDPATDGADPSTPLEAATHPTLAAP